MIRKLPKKKLSYCWHISSMELSEWPIAQAI
jgi:hypothetical protein